MDKVRKDTWSAGANNLAQPHRLPEGAAKSIVNLDATEAGTLELRPKFALDLPLENVRGLFALGQKLLCVSGSTLLSYNPFTGVQAQLATITAAGPVSAAELNGKLYIRTQEDRLMYDGETLLPWGSDNPVVSVEVVPGSLPAGNYKLAVTANESGHESGADVMVMSLPAGSGLRVTSPDSNTLNVYLSATDGQTLYLAAQMNGVAMLSSTPDGASRQLATGDMVAMPIVDALESVGSMIVGSHGKYLYHTDPMRPHLVGRTTGFVQFSADIVLMASVGKSSLFVATEDSTYLLNGLGTEQVDQPKVADYGAVSGTAVRLPDDSAAWFTRYGQVIGRADGSLSLLNQNKYAPRQSDRGASGFMENNGLQTVVTSLRNSKFNSLSVGDSWSIEVSDA